MSNTHESKSTGILGIGTYLPPEVRKNDWWPEATVRKWREKERKQGGGPRPELTSDGQRLAAQAMAEMADDVFRGAVERRVLADDLQSSDMELAAAREALARAGVDAKEIDLLLVFSVVPDVITPVNAPKLHHALGLPEKCLSLAADSACNSFASQLEIAEQLISHPSGRYKKALLIQSALFSRILPWDAPYSTCMGDGATAVVVGQVSQGRGVLGRSHHTDGTNNKALLIGCPAGRWYKDGATVVYPGEARDTAGMILSTVERGKVCIDGALAEAGLRPDQVDFFAGHQGLVWLRRVTQAYAGLTNARAIDTFKTFSNLSGANLPLILAIGEREGLIKPGDVVATFSGGAGEVWSSMIMRWGA